MGHIKKYSEFSNESNKRNLTENARAGAIKWTPAPPNSKLKKAAEITAKFINKKTKKDYVLFPFVVTHENKEEGYMFYSTKDSSAFKVTGTTGPALIGKIDYWTDATKNNSTYTFSSDRFPLVKLLGEITRIITEPKYIKTVNESILNEKRTAALTNQEVIQIENMLASNVKASVIARDLGVPYHRILKIRNNQPMKEVPSSIEIENEKTLEDRVKYLEETMEDIYQISRRVGAGGFNSLFITGRAGTGKTFNVERAMQDEGLQEGVDWTKISGSVSTVIMFKTLFQYKNQTIVFDDADSVFRDEAGRNILKAALDTKKVRNISYLKKMGMLFDPKDFENDPEGEYNAIESGLVPNKFDFTGRIIFISNLQKDKADPDGAIRSRSILIDVNPDDATLMERMRKLLPHLQPKEMPLNEKLEIYEFMKKAKDVSMRTFVKAAGFKMQGLPNWERMARRYL